MREVSFVEHASPRCCLLDELQPRFTGRGVAYALGRIFTCIPVSVVVWYSEYLRVHLMTPTPP